VNWWLFRVNADATASTVAIWKWDGHRRKFSVLENQWKAMVSSEQSVTPQTPFHPS